MIIKRFPASLQMTFLFTAVAALPAVSTPAAQTPRTVLPDGVVDLRTAEGVARVKAHWRYSDTRISAHPVCTTNHRTTP